MGMPQLVVTAVLVEGRSKSAVAREYGVSRRWVITLVQRYLAEGDAGLRPRPRRPLRSPNRTTKDIEDEVIALRKELERDGHGGRVLLVTHPVQSAMGSTTRLGNGCRWRGVRQLCGSVPHQGHDPPEGEFLWCPGWCGSRMGTMAACLVLCGDVCGRVDRGDPNTSVYRSAINRIMGYPLALGCNRRVGSRSDIRCRLLFGQLAG